MDKLKFKLKEELGDWGFMVLLWVITAYMAISIPAIVTAGLGTFQQDTCVDIRTILNTTAVNLSSISYPNNTVNYLNTPMTKNAQTFNYTFCDTNPLGSYIYDYYDLEGNVYVNDFDITYTGDALDEAKANLFMLFLAITVGFWFLILYYTTKLPSKNTKGENEMMQISKLKYLRDALFGILYALTVAILFLASNVAIAYLPGQMFGEFLFTLFMIMAWLSIPFVIIWFIWIFYRLTTDSELRRFMERGGDYSAGSNTWV